MFIFGVYLIYKLVRYCFSNNEIIKVGIIVGMNLLKINNKLGRNIEFNEFVL